MVFKHISEQEAIERTQLEYYESPLGFHFAIDHTFTEQVGEFKLLLPTGEEFDSSRYDESTESCSPVPENETRDYQRNSAITACEARIENGADTAEAFAWLNEELEKINKGTIIYE